MTLGPRLVRLTCSCRRSCTTGAIRSTRIFEQRAADLSVEHPDVVENYRAAHSISLGAHQGRAGTEQLRQAMVHFRALFDDLLAPGDSNGSREQGAVQPETTTRS